MTAEDGPTYALVYLTMEGHSRIAIEHEARDDRPYGTFHHTHLYCICACFSLPHPTSTKHFAYF